MLFVFKLRRAADKELGVGSPVYIPNNVMLSSGSNESGNYDKFTSTSKYNNF